MKRNSSNGKPSTVTRLNAVKPNMNKKASPNSPRKKSQSPGEGKTSGADLMKSLSKFPKIRQELLTVVSFV